MNNVSLELFTIELGGTDDLSTQIYYSGPISITLEFEKNAQEPIPVNNNVLINNDLPPLNLSFGIPNSTFSLNNSIAFNNGISSIHSNLNFSKVLGNLQRV